MPQVPVHQPASPPAPRAGEERTLPIQQTSLAARQQDPTEVTLQFVRWTAHANTAYQKGQFAGFKPVEAARLVAAGAAVLAK